MAALELRLRPLGRRLSLTRGSAPAPRLRLSPGTSLYVAGDALVVRVGDRWSRVSPVDAAVARRLVDALHAGVLGPDFAEREPIGRLVELGALVPTAAALVIDLVGGGAECLTAPTTRCLSPEALASAPPGPVVVLAPRDHPALGSVLRSLDAMRRRGDATDRPAWVGSVSQRGVVVAGAAPADGLGCARCAWLGDRAEVDAVPPVPIDDAPAAHGAAPWLARRCAQLVDLLLLGGDSLPPGCAWVEQLGSTRVTHPIPRHPACTCCHHAEPTEDASWDGLAPLRFAPVWPMERGDGAGRPARVVFRRSGRGHVTSPATLGVALGSGRERETRALAEAIERASMHHAPPDVRAVSAQDLGERAWRPEAIRALLFRVEERDAPGFRFADYDEGAPLDWCQVTSIGEGARRALVPAALVGHVDEASRLIAATSNGYACHRDRGAAIVAAFLELIERDAILLSWFLGRPWVRIVDAAGEPAEGEPCFYLCTQDIDLPVIFACACAGDGSLRSGSAAALDLDRAIARARSELAVALGALPLGAVPRARHRPTLDRVERLHGPEDHVAFHAGEAGRVTYTMLRHRSTSALRSEIDQWGPGDVSPMNAADALARVSEVLRARSLDGWVAERSLPAVFGSGWHVVRALVPGLVELSFGLGYRRLASPRVTRALAEGETLDPRPHPLG